jgi:co-chaperonin GroES (HSP10)
MCIAAGHGFAVPQRWHDDSVVGAALPQINSATVVAVGPGRRANSGEHAFASCMAAGAAGLQNLTVQCCVFAFLGSPATHVAARPEPPPPPPPHLSAGELIPVSVKEGDKVLLPDYGGTTVKLEEKE